MLVRRSVGDRVRKLLGRSEANVCSQEVPVPITSEGQTPIKMPPSEDSNEEKWAQLVATQYLFLNEYLKERLKERMKEGTDNSESEASDEEPVPSSTSAGRTHSTKMAEKKKKRERKDAYMHSRRSSVKRNDDIKKQVDWHHEQLKELLKNDIKEILKEQLATEHARMRKLLRKDVKKMSELIRNELTHICTEQ
ncbi:mCG1045256, partial [Mus musculus]